MGREARKKREEADELGRGTVAGERDARRGAALRERDARRGAASGERGGKAGRGAAAGKGDEKAGRKAAAAEKGAHAGGHGAAGKGSHSTASRTSAEINRHAGAFVIAALLVIASVVALVAPSWGLPLGTLLGGGNRVTLTATDGSAASADDVSAAASSLAKRASALYEKGVTATKVADDAIALDVPAAYDASQIAQEISGTGKVELARLDEVSDADALAKIDAGASGVTLAEGSYKAFVSSDNVTSAKVITAQSPYTGTTVYGVTMGLDSDGANALTQATDGASSTASVTIVVIVDGTVVATPSTTSKIEGGQITVSGGFTRDEAYALAAKLASKPLAVKLDAGDTQALQAAFGGSAPVVCAAAAVAVALVAGAVASRALGRAGWAALALALATLTLALGLLAVVARFDFVILGAPELAGLALTAVCAIACACLVAWGYRCSRAAGSSVRKAQMDAHERVSNGQHLVGALFVLAALLVGAFLLSSPASELLWALACGLVAGEVALFSLALPLVDVLTAADAARTDAVDVADLLAAESEPEPQGAGSADQGAPASNVAEPGSAAQGVSAPGSADQDATDSEQAGE